MVYRSVNGGIEPMIGLPGQTVALGHERALVNPGSVGQPRDGLADAAYALLETGGEAGGDVVEFRRVRYDIDRTQRRMLDLGLPGRLADRLRYGR
jgi:diadenosine tetraphosphatase ApaH/serine/threonine PP2A family protein phosphatase